METKSPTLPENDCISLGELATGEQKMKYVLIAPNENADVVFFQGVSDHDASGFQHAITTELLSDAHIFEYDADRMQYVLDKALPLQKFSAVPIQDVDIFKAKLAGK